MTEESQQAAAAPQKVLTKEERSAVAKAAATRRWAKAKKAAKKTGKKGVAKRKTKGGPREFSSALKMAEKQLAKALHDRDEAAARYAMANAEIPSLMRIITALKHPAGAGAEFAVPQISIEQVMADAALPYQNPSRMAAQVPAVPVIPVPPALHPANVQSRAQGGAIGVALDEGQDEDQFLRESGVAGGNWH